ncbi:MAG: monovalent cation/H(+) antiporter subunit G [Rhizobiaceae bacterium]
MISEVQNYIAGILMIAGAAFALVATIGIVRLPDIYSRMHAASKAGTVGSGATLIALAVFTDDPATTLRAVAAVAFLMLTAPVSAHLLAKSAYSAGYRLSDKSVIDDMADESRSDTGGS